MNKKQSRPICSPTVERLLLEIEGQAVKTQPKSIVQPKNYTKENIKRLKEIQLNCKKRESSASTPTKAKPILPDEIKVNRSNNVQTLPKSTHPNERSKSPIVRETNKAITGKNIHTITFKPNGNLRRSSSQLALTDSAEKCDKPLKKSPSLMDLKMRNKELAASNLPHSLGTVPKYLLNRKQKWKEEADKKQEALNRDATIPPGHSLMNEKERLETLQLLKKTRDDLLRQLICLPVQLDTMRAKHRKEDIESQLKKAEDGINIFSKSRVLIKHDM